MVIIPKELTSSITSSIFSGEESALTSVTNLFIVGIVCWLVYNEKNKNYYVQKKEINAVREYIKFKKSIEDIVSKLRTETQAIRENI